MVLATMAFALSSCGKSDSGGGTSGGAKQVSGMEGAAQDAALAEVKKHWSKAADAGSQLEIRGLRLLQFVLSGKCVTSRWKAFVQPT